MLGKSEADTDRQRGKYNRSTSEEGQPKSIVKNSKTDKSRREKRARSCCNCDFIRGIVSTNKKRMKTGEYNLDLTYITNRIIACGFPAEGFEGLYRNRKSDIVNFL